VSPGPFLVGCASWKILRQAHGALQAVKEQQTVNPDKDIWSDDRVALQDEIVRKLYAGAASVPCEGKAIIAGGLGGSGKTTVLAEHAGVDLSKYFTINPDQCKKELALHKMLPQVAGLSPMETSSLGHEESSYLARRLALLAYAEGKNVILGRHHVSPRLCHPRASRNSGTLATTTSRESLSTSRSKRALRDRKRVIGAAMICTWPVKG
jgi:hypothetical protein